MLPAAATSNITKNIKDGSGMRNQRLCLRLKIFNSLSLMFPDTQPQYHPSAHLLLYFFLLLVFSGNVTTCVDKTEDLDFVVSRYIPVEALNETRDRLLTRVTE